MASTISKATDTFVLRRDTTLSLNITKPGLMTSASPGTQEELKNYILIHDRQSKAIIGITLDLAKFLDKSQSEDAETKGTRGEQQIRLSESSQEYYQGPEVTFIESEPAQGTITSKGAVIPTKRMNQASTEKKRIAKTVHAGQTRSGRSRRGSGRNLFRGGGEGRGRRK